MKKQNVSEIRCVFVAVKKFWFLFELSRQLEKNLPTLRFTSSLFLVFRSSIKRLVQRHLLNNLLLKESTLQVLTSYPLL